MAEVGVTRKRPPGRKGEAPGSGGAQPAAVRLVGYALASLDEMLGPEARAAIERALGEGPEAEAARERLALTDEEVEEYRPLRSFLAGLRSELKKARALLEKPATPPAPPTVEAALSAIVHALPSDRPSAAIRWARALVLAERRSGPDDSRERLIALALELRGGGRYDPEPEAIRRAAALILKAARSTDAHKALGLARRRGRRQLPPLRERIAARAIDLAAKAAPAAAKLDRDRVKAAIASHEAEASKYGTDAAEKLVTHNLAGQKVETITTGQARRRAALAVAERLHLERGDPLSWAADRLRKR